MSGLRVKLRENIFHPWIIIRADNENLAWSGSRWVQIDSDGMPSGDVHTVKGGDRLAHVWVCLSN
jgi:hypothetical protein